MADTYSSAPFISHDAPDDKGIRAEIKVVTGFGKIFEIDGSDKGKARNVVFKVDNTKYKSNGWAPFEDPVIKLATEAEEAGEPIYFRIEQRRKDHIDRTIPINDLNKTSDEARDNTFKSLAAVKRADDTEWTISPMAKTNMLEDPTFGSSKSANDYTLEELQKLSGKSTTIAQKPKSNKFEAPPFEDYNYNGTVNAGSVSVSVLLNIYSFLSEYIRDHKLDVDEKNKLKAAKTIFNLCNKAQMEIYDGELKSPELSAGSHTRARALVFESIKTFYPLTEEIFENPDLLNGWFDDTYKKIIGMWRWSIKETQDFLKK